jgi:protein-disulfide isomerase-like protein with CxxC motif
MNKTLRYLFDPLCGWCYGATPTLSALLEEPGITVKLLPTGLFPEKEQNRWMLILRRSPGAMTNASHA